MQKKRILFIVNPVSGTSRKKHVAEAVERVIDATAYEWQTAYTERAGHATELAAEAAARGVDIVAAVGGDGTVNETASGLRDTHTALAIVPCGSGNGLARHLDLPIDVEKSLRVINSGLVHRLDYGLCDGRPFFCTCGVGFDAFISDKFASSHRRGPVSYMENILLKGLRYKPQVYEIEDATGSEFHKAYVVTCANASQYGNNAYIAPAASMKDGLLDVVLIEPFNALQAPQIALQMFNKTLPENSHVKTFRTNKLRIRRRAGGVCHVDGDPFEAGRVIEVKLVPRGLDVVVNPDAHAPRFTLHSVLTEPYGSLRHLQSSLLRQGKRLLGAGSVEKGE
ncbi:MAG: YegS/Rv2252/BmrU family lipid kinase [Bacteroidaceae bacterium]|nr:YegS/Rv2252/BmrU family lipid kinase [Bacteroidaceae bacterium]